MLASSLVSSLGDGEKRDPNPEHVTSKKFLGGL